MLQSQAFVYMAMCLAVKEMQNLDKKMLHQVNCVRESKEMIEELETFVVSAYDHGVLAGREAEAVLHPLHHHIKQCMSELKDSHDGLVVRNNSEAHGDDPPQVSGDENHHGKEGINGDNYC